MNYCRIFALLISLTSVSNVLADYPFEKIFTGKNQRYQLDKLRVQSEATQKNSGIKEEQTPVEKIAGEQFKVEQLGKTHRVRFGGYISHQNGSEVYWVDGETELGESALDVRVEKDKTNNKFIFHTSDSRASLQPGQVWLVDKHKIIENYHLNQSEIKLLVEERKDRPADAVIDNVPAKE